MPQAQSKFPQDTTSDVWLHKLPAASKKLAAIQNTTKCKKVAPKERKILLSGELLRNYPTVSWICAGKPPGRPRLPEQPGCRSPGQKETDCPLPGCKPAC